MREQAKTPESSFQRAYLRQKKREREQVRVFRALLLVSFLVLWEVAADLRWIDPFIFSSPVRVGKTFVTLLTEQNLLRHIGITVYETGISFLLVSALGMAFAVLLWLFPRFSAVMEPYLVVLNSLPKSALAPLLIVWMGANVKTIITAGISVAIFGAVISIYSSFQSVEPDMLRLIATLGGTKKDMLFRVVLPWSFPGLLAVWKVNIGLCLVGVVIGAALIWFLVMPSRYKGITEGYNKSLQEYSEQLSSGNVEINSLTKQLEDIKSEKEALEEQLSGLSGEGGSNKLLTAVISAANSYIANDTATAAKELMDIDVSSLPTDDAKKLYNTIAEAAMKPAANEFYTQGTTAYNKADYTTAATAFVNAYKCDSTKAEAAYYAAKSYVALNQTEDAKKYYQYIVDGFRSSSYYSEANAYVTSHS